MEFLTLTVGLLLPWIVGALCLAAAESRLDPAGQPSRLRQAGYGFFLGYAILTLLVLACDAWTEMVVWSWVMGLLVLPAAVAVLSMRLVEKGLRPGALEHREPKLTGAQKLLVAILVAWIGQHLLFAAIEVVFQPVYPWDAWETWIYRSKAWFLSGGAAEFVSSSGWAKATSPEFYGVVAASYPPLPTIIPWWAALSLGRWSETLINLPALLAGVAVGLALYGQCRESGMGALTSLLACYLLFSIPLFATHIALAGYADIWMAGYAGLGFMALIRGATAGQRYQTLLGLVMIALALLVKREAAAWLLAALLLQALITLSWRTKVYVVLACGALIIAAFLLGMSHVEIPLLGSLGLADGRLEIPFIGSFVLEVHDVRRAYWDNFFTMGNWNLLWLLVAAALLTAAAWRHRFTIPAVRASLVFILIFLATQLFVFGFTDQGAWADTYTAINRLPLHFVPALLFAALTILQRRLVALDGRTAIQGAGDA